MVSMAQKHLLGPSRGMLLTFSCLQVPMLPSLHEKIAFGKAALLPIAEFGTKLELSVMHLQYRDRTIAFSILPSDLMVSTN